MIDRVWFENDSGDSVMPYEDDGIMLVSFDAPAPKTKTYRVELDGADGMLDMTEWAGTVLYENRQVNIVLRDMTGAHCQRLVNELTGRHWHCTNSADPDYYYDGRVDVVTPKTRNRVTDITITMTCKPYKMAHQMTVLPTIVLASTNQTVNLRAARKPVTPTLTVEDASQVYVTFDSQNWNATQDGIYHPSKFVVTDRFKPMTVRGTPGGKLTISWQDGVL